MEEKKVIGEKKKKRLTDSVVKYLTMTGYQTNSLQGI